MRLLFGRRPITTVFNGAPAPNILLGDMLDEGLETLRRGVEAFAAAGVPAWVTYGTLLGLVREGRLLPHDNDLDMAVMVGADASAIKAAMAERGLALQLEDVGPAGTMKLKFIYRRVVLDIFFVEDEGRLWVDWCNLLDRSQLRSTHPPVSIETRRFGALDLPVPRDVETYLVHLYGPDWRRPVTRWNWYMSPPNAEIVAHWTEAPRLLERLVRWRLRDSRKPRRN